MKQNLYFLLLLLLLLLVFMLMYSQASARFLANNQVKGEVKLHKTIGGDSIDRIETADGSNLMGVEECDDGDEECFKRRIIAEAHLDYIYTQHHNHP
uniref:Phytosulfokine n=1 Tax=Nicotiana tabacum TaxID=4097 RepID=A0A1S4DPI2_TOBAC|nr:PREDICTED: putative phytosulfokines 6 isoform X2 [Nicotiana tabacum]